MRVLAVTNLYPSARNPVSGTFVFEQVRGLCQAAVEITTLEVDRLGEGISAYLGVGRKVKDAVRDHRPDLVHVMYGGVLADLVTRAVRDRPVVVTFRGSDLYGEPFSPIRERIMAAYGVIASRQAARRATGVITVSRRLSEKLPKDVPRSKVRVIPSGVDLKVFQPMPKSECQTTLGWNSRHFNVLFPANGERPVKRSHLTAAAVELTRETGIPAELHRLTGVSFSEVPVWMNASDVLILTSWHEGSPNVVKEALACNLPIVSVDVGDVEERIHGVSGCYIAEPVAKDLAAKLSLVFRGQRVIAGREKVGALSLETTAEELKSFYAQLLDSFSRSTTPARRIEVQSFRATDERESNCANGNGLLLSVLVPCYREAQTIERCIRSILAQEIPNGSLEIIVADGMSDDGTRGVLQRLAAEDPRVRVVDNPQGIVSTGLNLALAVARGRFIARMDAHTRYAPDYLAQCLATMEKTGADNVGGPVRAEAEGYLARAIAASFHSPVAVGGSKSHDLNYEGPLDSVWYGCWRREVFERVGLFDERLVRNQDDEFNLRLRDAGGVVWQSPRIKAWYSSRASLGALFRQYSQYGYWKVKVIQKHKKVASWRHLIPGAFVLSLISLLPLAPFFPRVLEFLIFELVLYFFACLLGGFIAARQKGITLLPILPGVICTCHVAYGLGFLFGVWDFLLAGASQPTRSFTAVSR